MIEQPQAQTAGSRDGRRRDWPLQTVPGPLDDKARLSRRRSYRETPDVVKATRRLILAVGKRIAQDDPDDLRYLVSLSAHVEEAFLLAVRGLRETGYSDTAIGQALGVSKQAVQQRWPR